MFRTVKILLLVICPTAFSEPENWEFVSDDNEITVEKKMIPGSEIVAFRGEADVSAPLAKVASVILDRSRATEWVDQLVEGKTVRQIGPDDQIEYSHLKMPLFTTDRDFVSRAHVIIDPKNGYVSKILEATTDPLAPGKKEFVRGEIKHAEFKVTPTKNADKTHVAVMVITDPKGSLPKWAVNDYQKNWPRKTIEGIRRQAAKSDVKEDERVKAAFAKTK